MNRAQQKRARRDADREARGLKPRTTIEARRASVPKPEKTRPGDKILEATKNESVFSRRGLLLPIRGGAVLLRRR